MKAEQEQSPWVQVIGVATVALISSAIALTIFLGWERTKDLFVTAGPAWVQALGAILAIYAAWRIADSQRRERDESNHVNSRVTLLRTTDQFARFHTVQNTLNEMVNHPDAKLHPTELLKTFRELAIGVELPTDEQLVRLSALFPTYAIQYADAISDLESVQHFLSIRAQIDPKGKDALKTFQFLKPLCSELQKSSDKVFELHREAYQAARAD